MVIAGALIGFVALALNINGNVNDGFALDRMLWFALRGPSNPPAAASPPWLLEAARDITALGGFTVLGLVTLVATARMTLHGRWRAALVFVSVVAIAQVASEVTKRLIGRPRPSLVPHLDLALSSSFPSGHALMSPVVYLTLAMTLTGKPGSGPDRALILAGAVMLCAAIGISRVFLGVHWPSDVLGGWSLGAAIALAAGAVIRVADEKSAQGNP